VRRPSIIYTPALSDATGGYDLRVEPQVHLAGAAHITGGGIWSKLGDLLSVTGYGADIEAPYKPPHIVTLTQRYADMPDYDSYAMWSNGMGMINVTNEPDKLIALANANDVEAKEIGVVTEQGGIRLRSAGAATPGKTLELET
jgi:phosphoribosylaminoimidazole (AIR) synthetase